MRRETAEIVAIGALSWLTEAELLDTFAAATGADLGAIRQAAAGPEFLGAVLDFVMMRDDWVQGVCEAQSLPWESLIAARVALPGGELPHWT